MALMVIWGGAMGGYWETGSVLMAKRPASMIMMAMTQAKMGRLMKNRGMDGLLNVCESPPLGKEDSGGFCFFQDLKSPLPPFREGGRTFSTIISSSRRSE